LHRSSDSDIHGETVNKSNFPHFVLALLPSGAAAFFVSQDYGSVLTMLLGPKSAHEEITRQSMLDVQALLAAQGITSLSRFESQENLASNPKLRGYFSGDAEFFIIQGVYCSDLPRGNCRVNLFNFWKKDRKKSWSFNPSVNVLHFIRNTIDQKYLESAYQTCTDAQKNLERLTIETFKTFRLRKAW